MVAGIIRMGFLGMENYSLQKADKGTRLVILASTICDRTWEALQTEH